MRTRRVPLLRTLAASLMAVGLVACDTAPRDFTLTDHHGQRFELASLRGTAVLVFFGYSSCPDVCPTTLSKLSAVTRRLGDSATGVKTLYVTVDPERDTPEVLETDLSLFRLDALGLTGTREEIDAVVSQFGAAYRIVPTPESAGAYSVSHTTDLYLLDRAGRLVRTFAYEATVEEIVEGIQAVLTDGA